MDDKTILQKVKAGDLTAIRSLVENHKNLIWHIIISMIGRHNDNEDVFQEVFLRVIKGLRNFRGEARLSTWIGSITHHVCVDYLRRKKRDAEFRVDETDPKVFSGIISDQNWDKNETGNIHQLLISAIARLPVNYRTVIVLYHLDEHTYKDISEITGMPEGTVKSYISRGRNQLREMLTALIPDVAEILNDI
jgi:RNA polymerase sigma-70 factor (ECF subfamily)